MSCNVTALPTAEPMAFPIIDAVGADQRDDGPAIASLAAGQRLALVLPSGGRLARALVACYQRGIVAVPVNPRLTAEEIRYVIDHSLAHAVLDADGLRRLDQDAEPSPAEDRYIVYTSGSTGFPKGVVLTRAAVESNARAVAALHGFTAGHAHATCLPLYHCNALMMSLLGSLLTGGTLVLGDAGDPAAYFAAIARHRAETASMVPALLHRLVEAAPPWPAGLRYVITAAAPLSRDLASRFHALYGPRLRQGYGLSEAVNFSCVTPLLDDAAFRRQYLEQWPPIGEPLPGTELRFVDGEVQVRGPNLLREYWRNPEATLAALAEDGWLRTGDLGTWRDGFVVLSGRRKEVINRGGESHYPVAVEEAWTRAGLPGRFTAVAVADDRLADEIGLWTEHPDPDAVCALMGDGPYRPAAVQCAPLEVTATGKPQRGRMGRQLISWTEGGDGYRRALAAAAASARRLLQLNRVAETPAAVDALVLLRRLAGEGEAAVETAPAGPLAALEALWPALAAGDPAAAENLARSVDAAIADPSEPLLAPYREMLERFLQTRGIDPQRALLRVGDQPLPAGAWPVVAALHWRALGEPGALQRLRERLVPGGLLVIAEPEPASGRDGRPWALAPVWRLWRGSAPRGRRAWLADLIATDFVEWGLARRRADEYDLGGLIWARRGGRP